MRLKCESVPKTNGVTKDKHAHFPLFNVLRRHNRSLADKKIFEITDENDFQGCKNWAILLALVLEGEDYPI